MMSRYPFAVCKNLGASRIIVYRPGGRVISLDDSSGDASALSHGRYMQEYFKLCSGKGDGLLHKKHIRKSILLGSR